MNNKIKNIVVTSVFALFIAFFVVMCWVNYADPTATSDAERRPLAQFPDKLTWEGVVDKTWIEDFEDYSVDQFPFREFFRGIKANVQLNILNLKENNGLAVEDDYIAKIEQDFADSNVDYSIGRLQYYYDMFAKDNGGKHYITLIPDKNYFLAKDYGYIGPDYAALTEKVTSALSGMQYIDIYGKLQLSDYYRTDTHWSQDKLGDVVDALASAMGISDRLSGKYDKKTLEGFKGVYYGQSALKPKPDTLTYLTNEVLENCTVYNFNTKQTTSIYDFEKFGGKDGYDFFLSGTQPLLRIDNPAVEEDKTLVVFRDSYGSSLTPLLVEAYKTVYVVDIRYIDANALNMYDKVLHMIDFEGADILFAYSALILNSVSFK